MPFFFCTVFFKYNGYFYTSIVKLGLIALNLYASNFCPCFSDKPVFVLNNNLYKQNKLKIVTIDSVSSAELIIPLDKTSQGSFGEYDILC